MVWGLIRVILFTTAFLVGLMVGGPGARSTSASSDVPACNEGRVIVIPVKGGAEGVIQLNCVGGKLVVARIRSSEGMEIIPKKRSIHYQL